jgi:DNA-directed RNA polymerase specialized sigma24 family protein
VRSLGYTAVEERPGRRLMGAEQQLHRRVVAGDRSALLEWLQLVGDVVYCAALSRTGSAADAADLTEALFLEVWRHPAMFNPGDGPLSLQLIRRMAQRPVAVA